MRRMPSKPTSKKSRRTRPTVHQRCDSIEEKMVSLVKQLNLYLVMHEREHRDLRQELLLLYEPESEVAH